MVASLLKTELPLVAAPMAGGPSTVALAKSVAATGGFPYLAGGYKTPDQLFDEIRQVRAFTDEFGVNLFVPRQGVLDLDAFDRFAQALQPIAEQFQVAISPEPVVHDHDLWEEKLDRLVQDPVPVVSFTFSLPEASEVTALRGVGTRTIATVTTVDEARAASAIGVDGLVVQGPAAGGHSATHDPTRPITPMATEDLVRAVRAAVDLPITAAGGVDGPTAVRELLSAGAETVAVGTLLLRSDESGASVAHKDALAEPRFTETSLTPVYTGRPARAFHNEFMDRFHHLAPIAYPAVHHLTRPIRQAAAKAHDFDWLHLWAGTGYREARTGPAARILEHLATEL
ncbi:nitronate monooxygenase [Gulosibacter chungangensis]|uniref:Propionate 3-nitronate monooxygenase n=1 Tax=Gulosibacter chungangensis TaxID=979746 RepID=A0A7J5B8N7_9MICO|nr:nitronate monooxygenase [Gulosibacter chungangensis]KAB1641629.1 nitronate monooxygenase [Gulosibacter chungangensis]